MKKYFSKMIFAYVVGLGLFMHPVFGTEVDSVSSERVHCDYRGAGCHPYACVPEDTALDRNMVDSTVKTYCSAQCLRDLDCGGSKCDLSSGKCSDYKKSPPPQSIRPTFFLNTVNIIKAWNENLIVGAGFVNEIAFDTTNVMRVASGGWASPNLPKWYGLWGGSASLAGEAQFFSFEAGISRYMPNGFLNLTDLSLMAVYQRQGREIWNFESSGKNFDRMGGGLEIGLLKNVYPRVEILHRLTPYGNPWYFSISISYMHDLLADIVPDRYRKYLPRSIQ